TGGVELERSLRDVADALGQEEFSIRRSGGDMLITAVFNLPTRRDAESLQEEFKRRTVIPPEYEVVWSITDWPGGVAASD
ncbi:MAG TPA: hypothetical protein VE269_08815, partial [Gaiellaceae bacterium]|nr:hypothetical protein [Gaiellaceae bacterium]